MPMASQSTLLAYSGCKFSLKKSGLQEACKQRLFLKSVIIYSIQRPFGNPLATVKNRGSSVSERVFNLLVTSLSTERMQTFLSEAGGNKSLAAALYFWNCDLSESLQTPVHFLEVVLRNAFHQRLKNHFGDAWYDNPAVGLTATLQDILSKAKDGLTGYPKELSPPGVISSVTLGFWQYLLANRYETRLWRPILHSAFPHAPLPLRRCTIYDRLERIRLIRNRIAHHEPIFNEILL